jgi:hypothetical protein
MAKATQFDFSYKEVVEALIRHQGLHEGIWSLNLNFGITAGNFSQGETFMPAAIVPVAKIGLLQVPEVNPLAVDASIMNPAPSWVPEELKVS